jgi:hypothetical protein
LLMTGWLSLGRVTRRATPRSVSVRRSARPRRDGPARPQRLVVGVQSRTQ